MGFKIQHPHLSPEKVRGLYGCSRINYEIEDARPCLPSQKEVNILACFLLSELKTLGFMRHPGILSERRGQGKTALRITSNGPLLMTSSTICLDN